MGPQRTDVTVSIAGVDEHKILWEKLIAGAPFFAKYQTKVEREISMAVLTPVQMSNRPARLVVTYCEWSRSPVAAG